MLQRRQNKVVLAIITYLHNCITTGMSHVS